MGEIAEMMLDGTMCQGCGEWLCDGEDGAGFPGFCEACQPKERPRLAKAYRCSVCRKGFRSNAALDQHKKDKEH